ncbi:hypothetical protein SAMN05216188_13018 [Lentzea xinjiangensis]|uniref:Uncharacterized protein n=1 Tax=Lentzea xinjiangensis TaxID=402600 RepID=A0A1H9W2I3_9PSEU|nr:hypothetical protein [Lentzea xinjiangensis]SES28004.1 hypothetical protein SAMN05216188_13018 [Lentzea xinjiangensis]
MRLTPVRGVIPVPVSSVEATSAELLSVLRRLRGPDGARDPGLEVAATQAAELALRHDAGVVAIVEHPGADPAVLVAGLVAVERALTEEAAEELCFHLADAGGPGIKEMTSGTTGNGYPAVIVERVPADGVGAQLQIVVPDPAHPRIAVFTLHSPTGRGWLELSGIAGRFVNGVEFTSAERGGGTRSAAAPPARGRPGRSASH